ncbi:FERM domain-containing protein 5-like isoform X15 [Haliotis rufescens]|uniref:FERM domain-containing protein 5-like isoform X15 n=1 Tax=Haliotis rufescens TaxID=6454 RepID=UPI00201E7727|nr:FERM domain-containing protein 5-like isoform X15 [Haliotis rufescens]
MFRKRSTKGEVQTEYSCSIRFLDDSEPIQLNFKKDTLGQWLFDRVCEKLSLVEKDYFGLRYVDAEKQRHWLDPLKTVYKQLKGVNPMVLCFRVKFYPEDPMKLHEEITRYYLYLQLRRDLHHGRLLCSPQDAVHLASYIVQSEVGDYDPQDHPPGYITAFKMLPKQNSKMEDQIQELHKTLKGQVPAEAESNFLKKASVLDTFGVDPHQVKDQRGDQLYLGVTHQGIMTFRGSRRTQLHKWNQIRRIAYEAKMFIVHVNVAEEEDAANAKKRKKDKKQQPHGYKCLTVGACKYLWRCAVEQQLFFTLASSCNAPKLKSGGTLFSRGSKFRFSGRCQIEALSASENIKRSEPKFPRTNSLPNFSRNKHTSESKSSTLNTSIMSEPVPEDRRRYNVYLAPSRRAQGMAEETPNQSFEITRTEAAVDVPGNAFGAQTSSPIVQESPVLQAPLAAEEKFDMQKVQAVSASAPGQKTPVNGSVPVDSSFLETSIDSMPSYQPNMTMDDEEEDERTPKPSLDEQIKQLEEQYEKITSDQNHIAPGGKVGGAAPKANPAPTSSSKSPPKSMCATCCKVLTYSILFAVLLMVVTFVVLFYTKFDHPLLDEGRKQLQFLEPVKHYIDDSVEAIANKFK